MSFKKISSKKVSFCFPNQEELARFRNDFPVVSVELLSVIGYESATNFLSLLQKGKRKRMSTYVDVLDDYCHSLFGDTFLWRLKNNSVICIATPCFTGENVLNIFLRMKEEFSFPNSIKLKFLDSQYRFWDRGDYFFMIYDENAVGGLI